MKNTLKLYVLLSLMPFSALNAQQAEVLSLDSCYLRAVRVHPLAGDEALVETATAMKIKNLGTRWFPSFELGAQASYQSDVISLDVDLGLPGVEFPSPTPDQYRVYLDVSQVIYDGGSIKKQKELETAMAEAEKGQTRVSLFALKEMVRELYFTMLLLQQQEKVLLLTDTLLAERIRNAESGLKNGVLSRTDLLLLQVEQKKLLQELEEIRSGLEEGRQVMAVLINMPVEEIRALELPEVPGSDENSGLRPETEWFAARAISLEKTSLMLKTQRMPRLVAFGQAGYGRPGLNMLSEEFDTYYLVGARLSWTVFDWNRNRQERAIIGIQADRLRLQEEAFLEKQQTESIREYTRMEKYRRLLESDREIVSLREEITRSSAGQLDEGAITATDFLQVMNAGKTAAIQEEVHRVMHARAGVAWAHIMGIPLK